MTKSENEINLTQSKCGQRVLNMEGTTADLKIIPILGQIMIFLRGCQRSIWGYGVLWMDYQVYSDTWKLVENSKQEACFYIINILVLSFLFGERALQNLMPLIERLLVTYFGKPDPQLKEKETIQH